MPISQRISAALVVISLFCGADLTRAAEPTWLNDIEHAKQVAARERKDLLINFTGTEWCESCMRLEREIIQKPEFAPVADRFVLVRLEYSGSDKRLPQERPAPHPTWVETYGVRGYPTVFLADKDGRPYAATTYLEVKPAEYVKHLNELQLVHQQRDDAFAKAAVASGIDQAKALADGLSALSVGFKDIDGPGSRDPLLLFYSKEIDAVIALDKDNTAKLRKRWQQLALRQQERDEKTAFYQKLRDTSKQKGAAEVVALLDARLAAPISRKFRKALCWERIQYLEAAQQRSEAIDFAKTLIADETFNDEEKVYLQRRIAAILGRMGRIDEAAAVYNEVAASVPPDSRQLYYILSDKADLYREAHRYQDALSALDSAVKHIDRDTVPWSATQAWRMHMLARLGRVDDTWALHKEWSASPATRVKSQASIFLVIAERFQQHGSNDAARDAARRAQETLDRLKGSVNDPKWQEEMQTRIAAFQANLDKAKE